MSNAANNRYVIVDKAWLDKIIGYAQRYSEIAEFSVKEAIVTADEDGTVREIEISFVDQPEQVEKLQVLF